VFWFGGGKSSTPILSFRKTLSARERWGKQSVVKMCSNLQRKHTYFTCCDGKTFLLSLTMPFGAPYDGKELLSKQLITTDAAILLAG